MSRYHLPTRHQIERLAVGDLAINAFGRMAKVTAITVKREDIRGRLFVHYYTETSPTSSMSMSMKEGELVRHAGLRETSAQLDEVERRFRAALDFEVNPHCDLPWNMLAVQELVVAGVVDDQIPVEWSSVYRAMCEERDPDWYAQALRNRDWLAHQRAAGARL